MQASILAWAVPAVFLAFGIGFAVLGRFDRSLHGWSLCFSLVAIGFASTILPAAEHAFLKPVFESMVFLLALGGANLALAARMGRRPRLGAIAGIIVVTGILSGLAMGPIGSATLDILVVQTGCALLMLLAATCMGPRAERRIDRVLFWLCVMVAASLGLQNVLLMALPQDVPLTSLNWRDSQWAFVFQLSGAISGVAMAFAVLLAIGLDLIEHHRRSSDLDALTLALNRRGFERRVTELRRGASSDVTSALIVADLDFFKQINDRYGHEAGDAVICGFAALMGEMAKPQGCVCRFGGEEFALFQRNMRLGEARDLANRIRKALCQVQWPFDLQDRQITASFGVVALERDESLWDAVSRADKLLYIAKSHGRNRVEADKIAPTLAVAAGPVRRAA
ncbi:GGDEF domain-containing protein [Aureimonas ureilytica]|uniref:GGDEF domain-containing protein n=1 Tax=Aureimonas ureilytica TaxID=401562 RepID=UPI0007347E86|nr:GGDEF domain-containing protein [Aureimonas ureilytica]